MFASWLRRALRPASARPTAKKKARPAGKFRPEVEDLESRLVRSVTPGIQYDANHVEVYCSDRGDRVTVYQYGALFSVTREEPGANGAWVRKDSAFIPLSG